jgi:hypothetical protein
VSRIGSVLTHFSECIAHAVGSVHLPVGEIRVIREIRVSPVILKSCNLCWLLLEVVEARVDDLRGIERWQWQRAVL